MKRFVPYYITLSTYNSPVRFHTVTKLPSKDEANLYSLFAGNPKAQTLMQ
ncbi:hypothetical protein [Paenibacillus sp. 203]|nr:hypothetical protein [Paenibacillus sp. MZ03-122A]